MIFENEKKIVNNGVFLKKNVGKTIRSFREMKETIGIKRKIFNYLNEIDKWSFLTERTIFRANL